MVAKKLAPDREQKLIETLASCENVKDSANHYAFLTQLKTKFEKDEKKQKLKQILEAIGNEDRLLILDTLREKDRSLCELEVVLQKTQPAVSHHIKILEECRLIKGVKHGKFTHYSIVGQEFDNAYKIFREWYGEITNWFGDLNSNRIAKQMSKSSIKD